MMVYNKRYSNSKRVRLIIQANQNIDIKYSNFDTERDNAAKLLSSTINPLSFTIKPL
jgi:hypothetical protein